jgi:hypothetical protein
MKDVNWCPFEKLTDGEEYDSTTTYFIDDGHYGLKTWTHDERTF